jgi:hypothetical protein
MPKGEIHFPKTEMIEFRLRQDLADRLPREKKERRDFLNRAVEHELEARKAKEGYDRKD